MRETGATAVSRLARLYEVAEPRLGCALVEANVVLVLADLRDSTNVLLFPANGGRPRDAHTSGRHARRTLAAG